MTESGDRYHRVSVAPTDALADVLTRIRNHGGRPVFLTVPAESPLFLTASEYRALRESVRSNGINLIVISNDQQRRDYAVLFNLVAVEDDDAALDVIRDRSAPHRPNRPPIDPALGPPHQRKAGPWAGQTRREEPPPPRPPAAPAVAPPQPPAQESTERALVPVVDSTPLPEPASQRRRRRWPWLASALLALAIVVAAATVLPQATVTLTRARTPVVTDVIFAVVEPGGTAPGGAAFAVDGVRQSANVAVTAEFPATGRLNVPDQPARGGIVFANPASEPVTLPPGTEIVSDGGLVYTLDEEVLVPAAVGSLAGNATGSVTAVEGGAAGNLRQGALSGLHESGVYFSNREGALSGGTNRTVAVVSEDDLAHATERLGALVPVVMGDALTESTGQPTAVVPSSVEHAPLAPAFDTEVGTAIATFSATATTVASGLTYNPETAYEQIVDAASGQVALDPGMTLDLESAQVDVLRPAEGDTTGQLATARVTIDQVTEIDDATLEALPDDLARARVDDARETVAAIAGVEGVTIEIKPDWLPEFARRWMPVLPQRIEVEAR